MRASLVIGVLTRIATSGIVPNMSRMDEIGSADTSQTMQSRRLLTVVVVTIPLLIGFVFVGGAILKAMSPVEAINAVRINFHLGWGSAWAIVCFAVAAEWLVGVLLIARSDRRLALVFALGLIVAYSLFIVWVILNGSRTGCGCGPGKLGSQLASNWLALSRNVLMIGGLAFSFRSGQLGMGAGPGPTSVCKSVEGNMA